MEAVPLSFFHVLVMLSAGGLLTSLAAHLRTPLAGGYLFFNGAVLLVFMALGLWLRLALPLPSLLPYEARAPWVAYEPVLWSLFAALLVVHLLLVRAERAGLATWVGLAAVGVGLTSLATGVAAYLPPVATPGVLVGLALLATAAGTLALGSVWSGWMLGHWYLVTPQLSPRPLLLINAGLAAALGVQALLVLGMAGVALFAAPAETGPATLLDQYNWWFGLRVGIGVVFPLVLSWMIWRTARTRSMMAATGLLYIATGAVVSGEIIARVLYFIARVPV